MSVLLALTLSAIVWLALPGDWQQQAQNGATSAARWVGSLDTRTLLVALIGLCVVEALALLFVPSYRKRSYLATTPALIPPVSVYLDAENQLSESTIRSFMAFLTKYLDGRRADLLLYFLDASGGYKDKRELLNHVGFRLVDAPHNPSGKKDMREAVDREIAMHAFERGILGPDDQEFIIVSGDGDYVPLIYRLVALGHRVQILALSPSSAYDVVEEYLGVTVTNLATVLDVDSDDLTQKSAVQVSLEFPQGKRRKKKKTKKKAEQIFVPQGHHVAPSSGEGKVYYAIAETLDAYNWSMRSAKSDSERNALLHKTVWNVLRPRLSSVGYGLVEGQISG